MTASSAGSPPRQMGERFPGWTGPARGPVRRVERFRAPYADSLQGSRGLEAAFGPPRQLVGFLRPAQLKESAEQGQLQLAVPPGRRRDATPLETASVRRTAVLFGFRQPVAVHGEVPGQVHTAGCL